MNRKGDFNESDGRTPLEGLRRSVIWTVSGAARSLVAHPFDVVRSELQLYPNLYRGAVDVIKQRGIRNLYKGIWYPTLGSAVTVGVHFHTFDFFYRQNGLPAPLAGAVAGFAGSIFFNTTYEHIRIKMSKTGSRHTSSADLYDLLKRKNMFFHGFTITSIRDKIGYSVFFTTSELVKKNVSSNPILVGSLSGVAMWTIIYPLDTIKTVYQGHSLSRTITLLEAIYSVKNGSLLFKQRQEEGLSSRLRSLPNFYRGYTICILRAIPVNTAIFLTIEGMSKLSFH